MILTEFPDLSWLKRQVALRFQDRIGVNGRILKHSGWPTVLLAVKSGEVYRDNIKGPFSLFGNMKGSSIVHIGNRKVNVDSEHFFITNSGQEYSLSIEKASHTQTSNVHFGEHFADYLIQSQQSSVDKILDDDPQRPLQSFSFHNRLIRKTTEITELIRALCDMNDELKEEELLAQLFLEIVRDDLKLKRSVESLPSIRRTTRDELVKRILLTVDYIYEFYDQPLSLDELAQAGAMSKFHFLRLFKAAMGMTPHQFVTKIRIDNSKNLLASSHQEVRHIAHQVGFPDSSSFSRAFYNHVGVYPSQYRV